MMESIRKEWADKSRRQQVMEKDELRMFLQIALDRKMKRFRILMRRDLLVSIIICVLAVAVAFVLDFQYKWIVLLLMTGFGIFIWVHHNVKLHLLHPTNFNGGLSVIIQRQEGVLRKYRIAYLVGLPLFTGLLTCLYSIRFQDPDLIPLGFILIGIMLVTLILVHLLWNKLYAPYIRQIDHLGALAKHLEA